MLADHEIDSDGEARSAAAARSCIRIFDTKRRTAKRLDIIDAGASNQVEADAVDHKAHTVHLCDHIVAINSVGKAEPILETGTPATIDGKPKNSGLALLSRYCRNTRGSRRGE